MLHSNTGLTDPMLEQVENHRTGPKIQNQHFSVVNKKSHNPLPPLPHTDRHTGLYTACKPTPSENTSSRQNWFYASCRKKRETFENPSNSKNTFIIKKSYCYTSFKTVSVGTSVTLVYLLHSRYLYLHKTPFLSHSALQRRKKVCIQSCLN